MHSFKVVLSQMPWKMSVLVSLIYTVTIFLSSEEQILMISEIRNEAGFPVFFVLFSLGLSNKGGVQLLIACAMKRCCECHPPQISAGGTGGNQSRELICVLCRTGTRQALWKERTLVLTDFLSVCAGGWASVMHPNQENQGTLLSISLYCFCVCVCCISSVLRK